MNIRPLSRYPCPNYPTWDEVRQSPALFDRIPVRWQSPTGLASLVGVSLMARTLLADAPEPAAMPKDAVTVLPTTDGQGQPSGTTRAVQHIQVATNLVAPLLAQAVESDGRGAFGCVVVNPPTFLSEDEAIELIRTELQVAGLKPEEDIAPDHMEVQPDAAPSETNRKTETDKEGDSDDRPRFDRTPVFRYDPAVETFDLGDRNRSVYVQYLSHGDYFRLQDRSKGFGSSVQVYDFPEFARTVSSALAQTKADRQTIFGVFFDPLARVKVPRPDTSGLDTAQTHMVQEQYSEAIRNADKNLQEKAREKLRTQVRFFVAYLRQQGILDATK